MPKPSLTSIEARQNIQRLVRLASVDGYLDVTMTMRLLDRSQMMAYSYLDAMVKQDLVTQDRSKHRWYLNTTADCLPPLLEGELPPATPRNGRRGKPAKSDEERLKPVRLFTSARQCSTTHPARRDPWVTALFGPPKHKAAA